MSTPLVAVAEGRELEKLAGLLEAGGVAVLRCPMLAIVDPEDGAPASAFIATIIAGEFDEVLFMTGEGVSRLLAHAAREGRTDDLIGALKKIRVVARGFKAVKALKALGITLAGIAEPPTSEGLLAFWREHPPAGRRVGIVRAGDEPATAVEIHLAGIASSVSVVSSYTYAPASNSEAVADLVARLKHGEIGVLALTSIAQARALMKASDKQSAPLAGILARTRVASIGPALTKFLEENGIPVDLQPESRHFLPAFSKTILESLK